MIAVHDRRRWRLATPARREALRGQLGLAGAQWLAGVGNLVFAVVAAKVLGPGDFAELGAFLGAYVLLHLPAAGLGAGAALAPEDLGRLRRRLLVGATVLGAAIAVTAGPVADAFSMSVVTVLALAVATPGAALLGLERGEGLGRDRRGPVAAGLVAEPSVRLAVGLAAAVALGPAGAAVAVVTGGYASLWVTRRARAGTPVVAPPTAPGTGRLATVATFSLFAVMQQQDLLVAKLRLAPEAAGSFAVLSTAGGAVAFATATIPLVLLPQRGRSVEAARVAVGITVLIGAVATVAAALVGDRLLDAAFGSGYPGAAALFPTYVAAMALLGTGRVLAARRCAAGSARSALATAAVVAVAHLVALLLVGPDPGALVATSTVTALVGAGALAVPSGQTSDLLRRSTGAIRRWISPAEAAALVLATVVALGVRLLSTRGLWVDEAITVDQAQKPFGEMIDQLRTTDVHPPLHHAVSWIVVRTLGSAEWAVRLPSVLAGALLVPVGHGLARSLYGRRTAVVTAALVAVAPFLVWYSQEARMYSMFVLFATASTWAQVSALKGDGRWAWVAYVASTTLMLATQWFAVVPLAAQQLVFAGVAWRRRGQTGSWRLVRRWLLSAVAVAVAVAPLLPILADQVHAYGTRRAGAATTAGLSQAGSSASALDDGLGVYSVLANGIWALGGFHSDAAMAQIAALWPLLMLLVFVGLGRGRSDRTTALLVCVALPTAAFVAMGLVKRDLFELRYFAAVVPLLLVLVARAMDVVLRRRPALVAGGVVAVVASIVLLVDQQVNGANPRRYAFEEAVSVIPADPEPGDLLLYEPAYLGAVIDYYAPDIEARPLGASSEVGDADHVWIVGTTRLAQDEQTSARVGRALAELQDEGWVLRAETEVPNVQVWELEE